MRSPTRDSSSAPTLDGARGRRRASRKRLAMLASLGLVAAALLGVSCAEPSQEFESCTEDADCADTLECAPSDDICVNHCIDDTDCSTGQLCTPTGLPVPYDAYCTPKPKPPGGSGGSGGSGGGSGGGGGFAPFCGAYEECPASCPAGTVCIEGFASCIPTFHTSGSTGCAYGAYSGLNCSASCRRTFCRLGSSTPNNCFCGC